MKTKTTSNIFILSIFILYGEFVAWPGDLQDYLDEVNIDINKIYQKDPDFWINTIRDAIDFDNKISFVLDLSLHHVLERSINTNDDQLIAFANYNESNNFQKLSCMYITNNIIKYENRIVNKILCCNSNILYIYGTNSSVSLDRYIGYFAFCQKLLIKIRNNTLLLSSDRTNSFIYKIELEFKSKYIPTNICRLDVVNINNECDESVPFVLSKDKSNVYVRVDYKLTDFITKDYFASIFSELERLLCYTNFNTGFNRSRIHIFKDSGEEIRYLPEIPSPL